MPRRKSEFFVIRDAVHGDLYLTKEEGKLIDTMAMQRLREVKQLGTANLVFPAAQHSRFEHSIGTLHMASRMIEAINRNSHLDPANCLGISEEEARIIRFASLLHDVTHIPQGHSIEDQTGLFARHDTPARYLGILGKSSELGKILESFGVRKEVLSVLLPPGHPERGKIPAFWAQVMNDTICADIFDYLKRDAYFTGLNLYYDDRLVNYFKVDRDTGNLYIDLAKHNMLREDILSECLRMLEARYYFSERVYYHHAKVAAGALVAKAAEHAIGSGALKEEDFYPQTDASLVDLLERAPIPNPAIRGRMRRLLERFRRRELPKRACVFPVYKNQKIQEKVIEQYFAPGCHEERAAKEQHIADRVRVETGKETEVILYCPARKMQLKEARIHVRWPGESRVRPLNDFANHVPRLKDLEQSYRNLWKFYIFSSNADAEVIRTIQQIAPDEFPGAENLYEL